MNRINLMNAIVNTGHAGEHLHPVAPASAPLLLDLRGLAAAGYLVPGAEDSRRAEELRVIKQPLLREMRAAPASPGRQALVMVTSALPGEGKTTLAINLAMSLAMEPDRSVLLVDLNGAAMRRLGVVREKGLMDLVADPDLPLHEVIRPTQVPRLSVLPPGRSNRLAAEVLASRAMGRLLDRLAADCLDRVVVIDAPPLLAGSAAKALATQVGQVVVVVQARRTPVRAVQRAFACLLHCAAVTSVLNRADLEAGDAAGIRHQPNTG